MIDNSLIGIDELLAERAMIDAEIRNRATEELAAIDKRRAQLLAIVGNAPANQGEVVDELAERRTRKAGSPKYRNPDNPSETWTGRGKKPNWLAKLIAAGFTQEYCRIEEESVELPSRLAA